MSGKARRTRKRRNRNRRRARRRVSRSGSDWCLWDVSRRNREGLDEEWIEWSRLARGHCWGSGVG